MDPSRPFPPREKMKERRCDSKPRAGSVKKGSQDHASDSPRNAGNSC